MKKEDGKVLVTGATGHLGLTLTKELVKRDYDVKGTVHRFKENDVRLEALRELDVELVEADLLKQEDWNDAVKDTVGIFHIAAVYKLTADKDPQKEIIDPSVKGVQHVFEAAQRYHIEKIVMTSSIAAIGYQATSDDPLTEEKWNTDDNRPYFEAKREAEKKARAICEEYDIPYAAINPTVIVGPNFYHHTPSTRIIAAIASNKLGAMPPLLNNFVDSRDVANAHIKAYEQDTSYDRYIVGTHPITLEETIDKIKEHHPSINKPKIKIPGFLFKLYSIFSSQVTYEEAKVALSTKQYVDTSRIENDLGWQPRPITETLKDTVNWIKEHSL